MNGFAWVGVFIVLTAGCVEPEPDPADACRVIRPTTTVDEVHDDSLLVDDGGLVLHARESQLWLADANGCHSIALADVLVGDGVGHDATEIAASSPGQAWPDTIVVHR